MNQIGAVILAAGIVFLPQLLNAQTATGQDTVVSVVADDRGLTLLAPDQVPQFGTFWLASPGFRGSLAPLPCPPVDPSLPVYAIADGQFLIDAIGGSQVALTETILLAEVDALVNLIRQIQVAEARRQLRAMGLGVPLPGDGGFDNGGEYGPNPPPLVIDTNQLWLEIVTVTNQTASLVIQAPAGVSNEVYELLYTTNLLTPPTNWQWVLRSYPDQTNLMVPNATDAQGFYRLRSPDDFVANDSLGTNFWLAFCGVWNDNSNKLSLTISSPVGATGRVMTPGLWTNGPTVIVSSCGDAAVNGTNVFRNLTADEQAAWLALGLSPLYTGYVRGTNWVVVYGRYYYIVAYDSSGTNCTLLYDKYGIDLTGSTNEWVPYAADPSLATPASYCEQVPLVSQFFTVAAGAVTNISIPLAAMLGAYDTVEAGGILVTSSAPMSVYGFDYAPTVSTAFTGYPTPLLGTNYCVMARAGWAGLSELAIVATMSNTTVKITPSPTANLSGHSGTNYYYVPTIQAGMTYQVASLDLGDDVTGTWIQSDKPIAVFAGATLAWVPDGGVPTGNPLLQEQMPVESWGKQVLSLAFAGLSGGDTYRILAKTNDTVIFVNGVLTATNQAGEFFDLNINGPAEFRASQPIKVAHFANGYTINNATNVLGQPNEGDPCEILLPPIGHCLLTNIITTGPSADFFVDPPTGFDRNYLNIIVAQSAITNTLVDGAHVAATNFVPVASSGYYGTQISVTNGTHIIISSQPIQVEVYGFGHCDAYGYSGGVVK